MSMRAWIFVSTEISLMLQISSGAMLSLTVLPISRVRTVIVASDTLSMTDLSKGWLAYTLADCFARSCRARAGSQSPRLMRSGGGGGVCGRARQGRGETRDDHQLDDSRYEPPPWGTQSVYIAERRSPHTHKALGWRSLRLGPALP